MLILEIDGIEYCGPQEWADVSLDKYIKSISVLKSMPKKLHALTFSSEKKEEISADDVLEFGSFYKKWVSFWFDIPENVAGLLPLEVNEKEIEQLGIVNLYNMLQKFMVMPSEAEIKPVDSFFFKGVKYQVPESFTDLNGNSVPMNKATFDEFYESVELKRIEKDLKEGKEEILRLLTAVLCRPVITITTGWVFNKKTTTQIEPYDSSLVRQRSKLFGELAMDKVWGAYFFFIKSRNILLANTMSSLKEQAAKSRSLPMMLFGLAGI